MKAFKFYAEIVDGELNFLSPDWVRSKMNELEDGRYNIEISKYVTPRSSNQNRYYWAIVVPLVKQGLREVGYDDIKTNEDAHEVLKHLFLKKKIVNHTTGEVLAEVDGSTADLATVSFNEYLESIWKWASEYLSLTIPSPNTQLTIV